MFELIDVIILIGISQGIFLMLTILRIPQANKRANSILALLIGIATHMLIGRVLMVRFLTKATFFYSWIFDIPLYLFGPLLFLYTSRLLFQNKENKRFPLWHFLPGASFLVLTLTLFIVYNPDTYYEAYLKGTFKTLFNLIFVSAIGSNLIYLIKSFGMLRKFKKASKESFSFDQNPVSYLTYFLSAILLIIVIWALGFVNNSLFDRFFNFFSYDLVWAVIPAFIFVIGYYSLKQPDLFRVIQEKETKVQKKRLTETESSLLQKRLDQLMKDEKIYLESELTLTEVSKRLQTSSNNLSWLLNNVYQTTFYDFINTHRINEFIKKVENQEHLQHTILALSFDVGFKSKSTFNKAFKLTMNDTPSNYIKKHRAA
ncbi:AraC family transcriptional regulator [Aureisphaera galaxeae]|uniref:helix-turn-helix domain-containing protein n=1 Tax=Aureisphaera galaxeae TaxID=1538023 RepID=UPI002350038A|nr:AraC family transcriptional regulator [Aureisphaera galaxeae]MDC8006022.1 AraC family transcriptional regulator [Aureisphaera galaxeae]